MKCICIKEVSLSIYNQAYRRKVIYMKKLRREEYLLQETYREPELLRAGSQMNKEDGLGASH